MAALFIIIVILVGAVIGLIFYYREKPKEMQKEIDRLRKSIVSEGRNFEQIEHRIETIKTQIAEKKKLLKPGTIKSKELKDILEDIESQLEDIINSLYLEKQT
jgi:septal ring factor EnvC (AmiA/AmiB activator)